MNEACLLVVSYYDRRPLHHLARLLESLRLHGAGADYRIVIVANRTSEAPLALPAMDDAVRLLERENLGMNIGAWDHGWRMSPGYGRFLFLQDECFAVREGWLAAILSRLGEPQCGLVGESINPAWDKPWSELQRVHRGARMPGHFVDGAPAERLEAYADFFRRANIDAGTSGRHLRSLVWAARRDVLERIGGFPIGANYGECIAAEIGVSRKIEAMGLRVEQVAAEPFRYFRHFEYNQDHPSAPFTHDFVQREAPMDAGGRRRADAGAAAGFAQGLARAAALCRRAAGRLATRIRNGRFDAP